MAEHVNEPAGLGLHAHVREQMLKSEAERHAAFSEVAPDLGVADDAAALLLAILLTVQGRESVVDLDEDDKPVGGDVGALQFLAQVYIGIRGFRTMRAARAALAYAYEAESAAFDRVLVELIAHRKAILDDHSGAEALAWLNRRRGRGISARVNAMNPEGLYRSLCEDSHGDPAPVLRLLDPEAGVVHLAPERSAKTRASLLMHAGFARDQAVVVASFAGTPVSGVEELDEVIHKRWVLLTPRCLGGTSRPAKRRASQSVSHLAIGTVRKRWCLLASAYRVRSK